MRDKSRCVPHSAADLSSEGLALSLETRAEISETGLRVPSLFFSLFLSRCLCAWHANVRSLVSSRLRLNSGLRRPLAPSCLPLPLLQLRVRFCIPERHKPSRPLFVKKEPENEKESEGSREEVIGERRMLSVCRTRVLPRPHERRREERLLPGVACLLMQAVCACL